MPVGLCPAAQAVLGMGVRVLTPQKDLIEAVPRRGSSRGFHSLLFRLGQRAPLFVFMRTELEKQKVFPMKAHLYHVKDTQEPWL